jgi:predicted nuclease of predicted toxin-antitoxin system
VIPNLAADECCPGPIVKALRKVGFDVAPPVLGESDLEVLRRASREGRVIVTRDKDFTRFVNDGHPCDGLVILRLRQAGGWKCRAAELAATIRTISADLKGFVTCISESGVARTPLPDPSKPPA